MGWATNHIAKLQAGETIKFRPHGQSMKGKIESGQLCTVAPIDWKDEKKIPQVGDIVLCKVNGKQYLHLISARQSHRFQISNNRGHVNGWTTMGCIYGKLVRVEA